MIENILFGVYFKAMRNSYFLDQEQNIKLSTNSCHISFNQYSLQHAQLNNIQNPSIPTHLDIVKVFKIFPTYAEIDIIAYYNEQYWLSSWQDIETPKRKTSRSDSASV